MTNPPSTRYELQLDVLERNGALSDYAAAKLLRSEFALALNASHFSLLSDGDIAVDVRSREIPQDGVARYTVVLELDERTPAMTDEQAAELVCREFRRALNASHFMRISDEDFCAKLIVRELAAAPIVG
jgi:EAL domain-containing protein (putative c-di-GMP-specific phosphodiesterase class I)